MQRVRHWTLGSSASKQYYICRLCDIVLQDISTKFLLTGYQHCILTLHFLTTFCLRNWNTHYAMSGSPFKAWGRSEYHVFVPSPSAPVSPFPTSTFLVQQTPFYSPNPLSSSSLRSVSSRVSLWKTVSQTDRQTETEATRLITYIG